MRQLAWFSPEAGYSDPDLAGTFQALEAHYEIQHWRPWTVPHDPLQLQTVPSVSQMHGRWLNRHTPVFDLRCLGSKDSHCLELAERIPGWLLLPPRGLLGAYLSTARSRRDGLRWLTSRLQTCQPYLGFEHARALWHEQIDWVSLSEQYAPLRPQLALGCLFDGLQAPPAYDGALTLPWPRPCQELPSEGRAQAAVLVGRAVDGRELLLLEQLSRLVGRVRFTLVLPESRAADWHQHLARARLGGLLKVMILAPGDKRFPIGGLVVNLHAPDSAFGWSRLLQALSRACCCLAVEGWRMADLPDAVELFPASELSTLALRIERALATPWLQRQRAERGRHWLQSHFNLGRFLDSLASALAQTPQRLLALGNQCAQRRIEQVGRGWLGDSQRFCRRLSLSATGAHPSAPERVAVLSPLPPARTGIASHNAMMLPYLRQLCPVDLVHDGSSTHDAGLTGGFELLPWRELIARQRWMPYRQLIYHLGNNPDFHFWMLPLLRQFPGVVVFHDVYLGMLINKVRYIEGLSRFAQEVIYSNGVRGLEQVEQARRGRISWDELSWEMLNRRVVEGATRLVVPSAWDRSRLLEERPEAESRTAVVPLAVERPTNCDRSASRARLGLPCDRFLVASFGFIVESKAVHLLIEGLVAFLRSTPTAQLLLVGDPEGEYGAGCLALAQDTGLGKQIQFTGFTDDRQYHDLLAATDLCIQLRSRSRGGGSYTIHQALAYGLPTLISNEGPFADFPDSVVMKVDPGHEQELSLLVSALYQDKGRRRALGDAGRQYAQQYLDPLRCARLLYEQVELAAQPRT